MPGQVTQPHGCWKLATNGYAKKITSNSDSAPRGRCSGEVEGGPNSKLSQVSSRRKEWLSHGRASATWQPRLRTNGRCIVCANLQSGNEFRISSSTHSLATGLVNEGTIDVKNTAVLKASSSTENSCAESPCPDGFGLVIRPGHKHVAWLVDQLYGGPSPSVVRSSQTFVPWPGPTPNGVSALSQIPVSKLWRYHGKHLCTATRALRRLKDSHRSELH